MVEAKIVVVTIVLALTSLLFLAAAIYFLCLSVSLRNRYRCLMHGQDGLDLEKLLNHYGSLIEQGRARQREADKRLREVEKRLVHAVAGIGLHRYNAFRETGSNLSFSLAFLDRNEDGVVVTSIFGREESRTYGKPVHRGEAEHILSEEELIALQEARRKLNR